MAGYSAAVAVALEAAQMILLSLQNGLAPTAYLCPQSVNIETIESTPWDYIIAGGGQAGLVVAERLAETGANTLVIEEGGCPPLESIWAGYFPILAGSTYDRAMDLFDDGYANQNQKHQRVIMQGKVLGGSGAISHLIYVPPNKADYDFWAAAANDQSWAFRDFAYYFAKGEELRDAGIEEQNTTVHGRCGPSIVSKEDNVLTEDMIKVHEEAGFPYLADAFGRCVVLPAFSIGDGKRQSGNIGYISKAIDKPNVKFLTGAVVSKILFGGTKAIGVEYSYKNSTYRVNASKKIIVSTGALKTPQLLMLSGIGNKTTLARFGIDTVIDNPEVGNNLADHVGALFAISLNKSTQDPVATDPTRVSATVINVYDALNKSQNQPEVQDIVLQFGSKSSNLLQFCTNIFRYNDAICDAWHESNSERDILLGITNLLHPKSTGCIELNSTNILDQPLIKLGHFSNSDDLDLFAQLMVRYLDDLLNTPTSKNLDSQFIDLGFCKSHEKFSFDYWKCYLLEFSTTLWHYGGTCAMGKVVDGNLDVIGTENLKVIDSSVIPYLPSGNIGSSVQALAEKGADIIKREDGYSTEATVCF